MNLESAPLIQVSTLFGVTKLDTLLTLSAVALAFVGVCLNYAQLRRTPKPEPGPEPVMPMSLTIIAVPMRSGRDLPGSHR